MIALVVLTLGIFTFVSIETTVRIGNGNSYGISKASSIAADEAERLLSLRFTRDYTHPDLRDSISPHGLPGLEAIGKRADGSRISSDGRFIVYWNIADGLPLPGVKRIRIHAAPLKNPERILCSMDYLRPVEG